MQQDVQKHEYLLDNAFFVNIDGEDVQKGKVKVNLTITKTAGLFDFIFDLKGGVTIPCDRCLDDMEYPVETEAHLIVKLGKDYSEDSDEVVTIPETEGVINLAWFLYEFVALAVPIKHVHAPGKCNKQMSSKLKKHSAHSAEDEEDAYEMEDEELMLTDSDTEESTDPRWDALKKLKDE